MDDKTPFDSIAVKPSRMITVLYVVIKQLFYIFLVEGNYWIPRGIAGIVMLIFVFAITSSRTITKQQMSILVPFSIAFTEIVLCALIGGDRLIYIFLIGCSLFSLMFVDVVGLFVEMSLCCATAAIFAFGYRFPLMGTTHTIGDEQFNFTGMVVIDILIFRIGKYSIGALARFRHLGQSFNIIIETSPNYIAVINDKARVEYISTSLAKWLGIDSPEYAANLPFIDLFPSADMKLLFGEFMRRKGSIEETFEVTIDGRTNWFMLRSVMMGEGKIARFFEWVDITPIIESQKAAEAAAETKSSFLARMSHEIRTPMNAVVGITELILREPLPMRVHEHALSIKNAGNNLLSIINDILDFSKIESGKLEIVPSEYIFASLINDVINIIRIKTAENPIYFVVNLNSAIPDRLIGDETRIRQMLINLLNNAVKYTREGFISLTINGYRQDESTVLLNIEVADSGIGIKPEDMDKLFGDFVQVDAAANKGVQGTGLGLAITKSLCHAMGGDISVYSKYGDGSTFTVLLPQRITKYEKFASVTEPSEKKVLLYELRDIYADSIACSIDNLGVECTLVQNEEAFCEALAEYAYPFVFVSSFLFESAKRIITKLGISPSLVLLAEYGEVVAEKNTKTIAMPVHSISIANILNDVTDTAGYGGSTDADITFSAPTARILVVDDIPTNLKVAEGLMAPYNMLVDTCLSGEEAIEKVKETIYDVIFMDHMMPGMDGIEATRLIREMDGDYYESVPIIALTANAMSGIREMFLQNGMDDFLPKPIEVSKLNSVLERWLSQEKKEKQTERRIKPASVSLKIDGIDVNAGIVSIGGDAGRYKATLSLFYKDGMEKIVQIKDSLANGDTRLYITYVHALKSSLYSIGARELSGDAKNLEDAGNSGDMEYIENNNVAFLASLGELLANINNAVSVERVNDKKGGKIDKAALTALKKALDEIDVIAINDIINELRSQDLDGEFNDAIERIYQSVLLFEYDEATDVIDGLTSERK